MHLSVGNNTRDRTAQPRAQLCAARICNVCIIRHYDFIYFYKVEHNGYICALLVLAGLININFEWTLKKFEYKMFN